MKGAVQSGCPTPSPIGAEAAAKRSKGRGQETDVSLTRSSSPGAVESEKSVKESPDGHLLSGEGPDADTEQPDPLQHLAVKHISAVSSKLKDDVAQTCSQQKKRETRENPVGKHSQDSAPEARDLNACGTQAEDINVQDRQV
ncbi:unnamed protein product [Rangifer tarandus platyrhynchus]|uniref:Uncharacterized protein n=2 Tax=Rangifer tarandus platyrhynchus TaxID=3082113 RepID=A0ACB0E887_RANTA|nr:unnamed protein product [Rangifer tarandus platyrhynchus]CAI9696835.1 unnamed protein product [Rangifer tarandus platyrhynchus]